MQASFNESACTAEGSKPAELAADVQRAYADWGRLVKAAHIEKQ